MYLGKGIGTGIGTFCGPIARPDRKIFGVPGSCPSSGRQVVHAAAREWGRPGNVVDRFSELLEPIRFLPRSSKISQLRSVPNSIP